MTGGTSYVDTTVAAGTTHSYTVSAVDAAGNRSAESTAASATTPTEPPPTGGGGITVGASSQAVSTAQVTSVQVGKPAGVAAGDVLIAQFTTDGVPSVSAVPSGWSEVVGPLSVGSGARVFVYSHVVVDAAAEPASWTWRLSIAKKWNAGMTAFRGVDTTTPFATAASTVVNSSGSTTVTVPGVTASAGAVLVGGVGLNSGATTVTPPSGWTEALESSGAQVAEMASQARSAAGPTGSARWTLSSSQAGAGWLRALSPAS